MTCIFCSKAESFETLAHIVPESLGGKHSPIGAAGVTCDACNQYFGQKVESKALSSFPFIGFRVLTGVPSKKKKMPSIKTSIGNIYATAKSNIVELEARCQDLHKSVINGQVTQFRLIAEVTEPLAVCRMLLKIGLEQLGKHFYEVAISERVQAAREFARSPKRDNDWWFIIRSNPDKLLDRTKFSDSSIEIVEHQGKLISVLHLPGISTMTPLERSVYPPTKEYLPEPEYRIIYVTC